MALDGTKLNQAFRNNLRNLVLKYAHIKFQYLAHSTIVRITVLKPWLNLSSKKASVAFEIDARC